MNATVVVAIVVGLALAPPPQPVTPDPGRLLDLYSQGQFDASLASITGANQQQARAFRTRLLQTGRAWIDAVPADRSRRFLVAAAFALESERINAERGDWMTYSGAICAGRCVIEWACALFLDRGAPDEAERAWMLASIALVGGVRDWPYLQSPLALPTPRTIEYGHLIDARTRLPDEPRFQLARAIAFAARYAVTSEMDAPRAGERTGPAPNGIVINTTPMATRQVVIASQVAGRQQTLIDYAIKQFSDLTADPVVGPEARARLAYLRWRQGDYEGALADAQGAAAAASGDVNVRYIATFLAAQAAQTLGNLTQAEDLYAAALEVRPHSQSATFGWTALLWSRGEIDLASDLIDASRQHRAQDDDPWRLFLYGDYIRLPELMTTLRQKVAG